jgi:hypothetical protein
MTPAPQPRAMLREERENHEPLNQAINRNHEHKGTTLEPTKVQILGRV